MSVEAKAMPAKAMSSAPTRSTRRRPNRSACVVSHREIAASPRERQPEQQPDARVSQAERGEVQHEHDRDEAVAEHPEGTRREQDTDVTRPHRAAKTTSRVYPLSRWGALGWPRGIEPLTCGSTFRCSAD